MLCLWRAELHVFAETGACSGLLCRANHKSVLGIGAYAQDQGVLLSCVDEAQMEELAG